MMLEGDAKRDYTRRKMRRKRAGEPTVKPKPEKPEKLAKPRKPTRRMVHQVRYWFKLQLSRPHDLRGIGSEVVAGLAPNNDDGTTKEASWTEALRRYKAHLDQQRADRERAKAERHKHMAECCSFCCKPQSAERIFLGPGTTRICEACTARAAALFLKRNS
jgi:hypothetical protein